MFDLGPTERQQPQPGQPVPGPALRAQTERQEPALKGVTPTSNQGAENIFGPVGDFLNKFATDAAAAINEFFGLGALNPPPEQTPPQTQSVPFGEISADFGQLSPEQRVQSLRNSPFAPELADIPDDILASLTPQQASAIPIVGIATAALLTPEQAQTLSILESQVGVAPGFEQQDFDLIANTISGEARQRFENDQRNRQAIETIQRGIDRNDALISSLDTFVRDDPFFSRIQSIALGEDPLLGDSFVENRIRLAEPEIQRFVAQENARLGVALSGSGQANSSLAAQLAQQNRTEGFRRRIGVISGAVKERDDINALAQTQFAGIISTVKSQVQARQLALTGINDNLIQTMSALQSQPIGEAFDATPIISFLDAQRDALTQQQLFEDSLNPATQFVNALLNVFLGVASQGSIDLFRQLGG